MALLQRHAHSFCGQQLHAQADRMQSRSSSRLMHARAIACFLRLSNCLLTCQDGVAAAPTCPSDLHVADHPSLQGITIALQHALDAAQIAHLETKLLEHYMPDIGDHPANSPN